MRVVLFSENLECLKIIYSHWDIVTVFCDKEKISQDFFDYMNIFDIPYNFCTSEDDMFAILDKMPLDLGISFGCGTIFSSKIIDKFDNGILNIHTGRLPDLRGRHPISWAFLLNEWEITTTFHIIDEHIDRGLFLHSFSIKRELNDSPEDILLKIEKDMEENLLIAIQNIKDNKYKTIDKGKYYPSLANLYKEIDPKQIESKFLFNLFKSQSIYGGVKIDGKQYTSCHFYIEGKKYTNHKKIKTKDGAYLVLEK